MDLWLRDKLGVSLDTEKLGETTATVQKLLDRRDDYKTAIEDFMAGRLYNRGCTAKVGGEYIIGRIKERRD
jgi:hypothetical protein